MLYFYRSTYTLPGFEPRQPDWTQQDESELMDLLTPEAITMIQDAKVGVIIPSSMPPPPGGVKLTWADAVAGMLQVEEADGILMAFSMAGLRKFIDEIESVTTSKTHRNRLITSSVIHEMTHLKQMRDGRIKEHPDASVTWEGVHWTKERCAEVGYIDLPWEHEAFQAQFEHIANGDRVWIAQLWVSLREGARKAGIAK